MGRKCEQTGQNIKDELEASGQQTLPEELERRQDRLAQIREAKSMIEERAKRRYKEETNEYDQQMAERAAKEQKTGKKKPGPKPKPPDPGPAGKDQVNFTDPESRIMPTSSNGWQQAYNGQAAVDMNSHLIVGGHLSQAPNDKQQLRPMLDILVSLPEEIGTPNRIAADNGYYSEANAEEAADRGVMPYLAIRPQT